MKLPDQLEDEIEAVLAAGGDALPAAARGRILPVGGGSRALPAASGGRGRGPAGRHDRRGRLRERRRLRARARVAAAPGRRRCTRSTPSPTGANINDGCGALHPEVVAAEVVRLGADAGVSHDGDADRALFADAAGDVIDGDQVLAASAVAMQERGALPDDTVVATVMSNLGFLRAMQRAGIEVVQARVGDRYVLEEMETRGRHARRRAERPRDLPRAGDHRRRAPDGRAVPLAGGAARASRSGELAAVMRRYPAGDGQRRASADREALADAAAVEEAVAAAEAALGDRRPGAGAPLRHRAADPRDGRGRDRGRTRARHADAIADAVRRSLG